MESLATLVEFTDKYPQLKDGKLQYAFLGGTAVRLNQALVDSSDLRLITDLDLLVFEEDNYPVHQCRPNNIFSSVSLDEEEARQYVRSAELGSKTYHFMNGTFLTFTKTCAVDNPREKDYNDIAFLNNAGLVDFNKLKELYSKALRVTKNFQLVLDTLKWFLDSEEESSVAKTSLFCTFPRFVNLLDEFEETEEIKDLLVEFAEEYKGDNNALSSVIYNVQNIVREFPKPSESVRKGALEVLLTMAGAEDYRDFDRYVNYDVVPKMRYEDSVGKKLSIVRGLLNSH